jgi:hypothetical protein
VKKRDLLLIFLAAVVVHGAAALLQLVPGYMDAEYYYAGGLRLVQGYGFSQPFLWNYLDNPSGIPHLSHTYWMPLPSLVAALGMWLSGSSSFIAARLGFTLLAGLVAGLTAWMAHRLTGLRFAGWLAGLLVVFSGFYLLYLSNTESFSLYMLLGSLFLLTGAAILERRTKPQMALFLGLGVLTGLMHLSRADGLLWLLAGAGLVLWSNLYLPEARFTQRLGPVGMCAAALFAGYIGIMFPWYARNLEFYGSLFAPGGAATLWLTDYNQTFSYPADQLTFQNWAAAGWLYHLAARVNALGMNLKNALAVQGMVFLTPLMLIGAWRLRDRALVRLGATMWLATLCFMTFVFPYSGARGGFIHSGAAVQPLLFALVPAGLEGLVAWGRRVRGWRPRQALPVFAVGLMLLSVLYSLFVFGQRVTSDVAGERAWRSDYLRQQRLGQALSQYGVAEDDLVMVNNPPGFFVATGRSSIVIPAGDIDTVIRAGERFGASYLLLSQDTARELESLYQQPGAADELDYQATVEGIHIFKLPEAPDD